MNDHIPGETQEEFWETFDTHMSYDIEYDNFGKKAEYIPRYDRTSRTQLIVWRNCTVCGARQNNIYGKTDEFAPAWYIEGVDYQECPGARNV